MAEADPEQGGENRRIYDACAPELFRRLRRGFGYVVRGGERRFLRITSRFEQEEVVQETFCRFLTQRQRGTFDPSQDPEPYVMRIGYYTALRYAGRLSREIPVEEVRFEADGETPGLEDASEVLLREETVAQVRSVLTTLSEKERQVYELSYESGLSQAKVGEALALSRDQVYRTLVSIRARVVTHLRGLGWLDEA